MILPALYRLKNYISISQSTCHHSCRRLTVKWLMRRPAHNGLTQCGVRKESASVSPAWEANLASEGEKMYRGHYSIAHIRITRADTRQVVFFVPAQESAEDGALTWRLLQNALKQKNASARSLEWHLFWCHVRAVALLAWTYFTWE